MVRDRPSPASTVMLAALGGVLLDATVAHGLLWRQNPGFTYWLVTFTVLVTALLVGGPWSDEFLWRGLLVVATGTIVHELVSRFALPLGLPGEPFVPQQAAVERLGVHLLAFGSAYLGARALTGQRQTDRGLGARVLVVSGVATIAAGAAGSAAIGDVPQLGAIVARFVVAVPLVLAVWSLSGRTVRSAFGAAVVVALAWTALSAFVVPDAVSAAAEGVRWTSAADIFLVGFPVQLAVLAVILVLDVRLGGNTIGRRAVVAVGALAGSAVMAAFLVPTDLAEIRFRLESRGRPTATVGTWVGWAENVGTCEAEGGIRAFGGDRGLSRAPHTPRDSIFFQGSVRLLPRCTWDGYPIPLANPHYAFLSSYTQGQDPKGSYATLGGVGFDVLHGDDTGVGSRQAPRVRSRVAGFATAQVTGGGGRYQPARLFTVEHADLGERNRLPGRLVLEVEGVEDPFGSVNGGLLVGWPSYHLSINDRMKALRPALGWGSLSLLFLGLLALHRADAASRVDGSRA